VREDVQQLEQHGKTFGSGGEGGEKEEGEMPFSQWMDIRMSMSEEQWAVYQQKEAEKRFRSTWQGGMDVHSSGEEGGEEEGRVIMASFGLTDEVRMATVPPAQRGEGEERGAPTVERRG
jgi:hypothetical protein